MGNIVGYALKGRLFFASLRFYTFFVKIKKPRTFGSIELFVSGSRLELLSALANINPICRQCHYLTIGAFKFCPFFVKTKKLRTFTGIELFVSRSRLELPSAAADIMPMLNELRF